MAAPLMPPVLPPAQFTHDHERLLFVLARILSAQYIGAPDQHELTRARINTILADAMLPWDLKRAPLDRIMAPLPDERATVETLADVVRVLRFVATPASAVGRAASVVEHVRKIVLYDQRDVSVRWQELQLLCGVAP